MKISHDGELFLYLDVSLKHTHTPTHHECRRTLHFDFVHKSSLSLHPTRINGSNSILQESKQNGDRLQDHESSSE